MLQMELDIGQQTTIKVSAIGLASASPNAVINVLKKMRPKPDILSFMYYLPD